LAERTIQTLRAQLQKRITVSGKKDYIHHLQPAIDTLNHTVRIRTGFAPADIQEKDLGTVALRKWSSFFRNRNAEEAAGSSKSPYKLKDKVRIALSLQTGPSALGQKASLPQWTSEVFEIAEILSDRQPLAFRLRDSSGTLLDQVFPIHFLQKAEEGHEHFKRINRVHKRIGAQDFLVSFQNHPLSEKNGKSINRSWTI
jgi:hypothetical protein